MHWWYLASAIGFEVLATLSLKQQAISGQKIWWLAVILGYVISFALMGLAMKKIDLGVAYAIWAGFGTATIALLGWLVFQEVMTWQKIVAISLIILGTLMLKLQSS